MSVRRSTKHCNIVLHDDRVSSEDILAGPGIMRPGEVAFLSAPGARQLCIKPADVASNTDEISVHALLAKQFNYINRTTGTIRILDDLELATADHVGLSFRDQFLSRADIWQIMSDINGHVIYRGRNVKYLDSPCAEVQHIYVNGKEVDSAYIAHPKTKPIFRSNTARYTILVEASLEMVEKWYQGELMFERLIIGYMNDLFERWRRMKVRHTVTVILYGKTESQTPDSGIDLPQLSGDFYFTVVSDASGASSSHILRELKKVFNTNLLPRKLSLSSKSKMLDAIHLAARDFGGDQTNIRPTSAGNSIIVVTACAGPIDTTHSLLQEVTLLLMGNSIGVDIVALCPKPTHPVPLFRYGANQSPEYALPHWVDISFWNTSASLDNTLWSISEPGPIMRLTMPRLLDENKAVSRPFTLAAHDKLIFDVQQKPHEPNNLHSAVQQHQGSHRNEKAELKTDNIKHAQPVLLLNAQPETPSDSVVRTSSTPRPKREKPPPHHLMRTGRTISLGPRGIAPSRGSASTILSVAHAQHDRDSAGAEVNPAGYTSGSLAKAIRASLNRKPSQQSLTSNVTTEPEDAPVSEPIQIRPRSDTLNSDVHDPVDSIEKQIATTMITSTIEQQMNKQDARPTTAIRLQSVQSDNTEADGDAPWLTLRNPCYPRRNNMHIASQFRKWQHVFPHVVMADSFKWASMCTPAMLPITTEYRPSPAELESAYIKNIRRHVITHSPTLEDEAARTLMESLIRVRLLHGFQIVAIPQSGSDFVSHLVEKPILLALGQQYHEVQSLSDFEAQVVIYERKSDTDQGKMRKAHSNNDTPYTPMVRMPDGTVVASHWQPHQPSARPDWNLLDEYVLGLIPAIGSEHLFRLRMVLYPISISDNEQNASSRLRDLSVEERCLEGIQKLTQMWQKQRWFSGEDRHNQVSLTRPKTTAAAAERDPNPLAIEYHTRETSIIVNAHGAMLSSRLDDTELPPPLFPDADKHHSSKFDVGKLAKQMQSLPPYGVEMRDRRWLTQTHPKCFRGDELTTWLLGAFKDVNTRDDAVAVGNELMERGIFTHVHDKHRFRDGHYFYQITSQHRTSNYPDTLSVFSKVPWRSTPVTPLAESVMSPDVRSVNGDTAPSNAGTPVLAPTQSKEVLLSQMLQYNVDPQRKSKHLHVINIHYDRIHNPYNCYHIQLEWLGASMKLTREALSRWTGLIESYGLKFVQMPLEEACKCGEQRPYEQTLPIKLAIKPPNLSLATPLITPHTFSPREKRDKLFFHKELLRHRDFVLDYEAASAFRTKERVSYSWGPPSYKYTQFVHRSGLVIAQVVADDAVDFLLLPNRFAAGRPLGSSKHIEADGPYDIIRSFRSFCNDADALAKVYAELDSPRAGIIASPLLSEAPSTDFDVPPMSLPPHALQRSHGSAFWNRRPG